MNKEVKLPKFNEDERMIDEKNGKRQPWRQKKIENLKYADYLQILKFKKAYRVHECAEKLALLLTATGKRNCIRHGSVNLGYAQCANGDGV